MTKLVCNLLVSGSIVVLSIEAGSARAILVDSVSVTDSTKKSVSAAFNDASLVQSVYEGLAKKQKALELLDLKAPVLEQKKLVAVGPLPVNYTGGEVATALDFAKIAYHAYDENSTNDVKRARFADDKLRLQASGHQVLGTLKGETGVLYKQTSNLGIVTKKDDTVYIAFRGTKSVADLLTDINIFRKDFNGLGGAHAGFVNTYHSYAPQLHDMVAPLVQSGVVKKIQLLGHSLGGAQSRIAGLDLAHKFGDKIEVKVATFNEPRSGDHALAASSQRLVGDQNHLRVEKGRDTVSAVNFGVLGNKHVGTRVALAGESVLPLGGHSMKNLPVEDVVSQVEKHNQNPTKIDGIRTTVQKTFAAAKTWIGEKAQQVKTSVVSAISNYGSKVGSWFGY